MEAISCGIVPVLSDSKNAALYQFALSENNLFKNGDEIDLARKIDYWLDNKKKKDEMSKKYVEFMQEFKIQKCMDKMEEMFEYAIKHNKNKIGLNPLITLIAEILADKNITTNIFSLSLLQES